MQAPVDNHTSLVAGGGGGVSVLTNNGAGNFSRVDITTTPAGSLPGVAVGDFNGDGYLDIVTIGDILFGQPGGTYYEQTFTPPDLGSGTGTGALAAGDVNGDGYADIAFLIYSPGQSAAVIWLGGPGTPGSWAPSATETDNVGSCAFSVATGDLNSDGRADVVVANGCSNSISVFNGSTTSPYLTNQQDYSTFGGGYPTPDELRIADVNGDGKLDLLAVGRGPSSVSVFLNDGTGGFGPAIVTSVGPLGTYGAGSSWDSRAVNVGDFNNDGMADIVVPIPWNLNPGGPFSQVAILYGDGTGAFSAEQDYAIGNSPASVVVGDFDGNGWADFAVGNSGENSVTIMLNNVASADATNPVVSASLVSLNKGGDDESTQSFRIVFTATDNVSVTSITATLNGIAVTNGQVVKLKLTKNGAQRVTTDDGRLQIAAPSFTLKVTAFDAVGNSATATATAVPVFVKNGKDDDDKGKGEKSDGKKNDGKEDDGKKDDKGGKKK